MHDRAEEIRAAGTGLVGEGSKPYPLPEGHAVSGSASPSSSSSSIGEKVASGLVESVIGLRPLEDDGARVTDAWRESA